MKKKLAAVAAMIVLATGMQLAASSPAHAGSSYRGIYGDTWAQCQPDGSVYVYVHAKKVPWTETTRTGKKIKRKPPVFGSVWARFHAPQLKGHLSHTSVSLGPGVNKGTSDERVRPGLAKAGFTVWARHTKDPRGHVLEGFVVPANCKPGSTYGNWRPATNE